MISRRDIFKMLGLAGLGGFFAGDLEAIVPRLVSDIPPELGYAVKEIALGDGYVLVQIASTRKQLEHYIKTFDENTDIPDRKWEEFEIEKSEEESYRELIRYYGSADYKEKQRQWREAMEKLEKEFPSPKRA
jgi:hypothetical protein